MFKVGDKVVNDAFINSDIYVFKKLMPEIGMALIAHDDDEGACGLYSLRHATPEEIAAGHRIDTNTGVTVITPKGTSKVKGGLTAFVDMGDDTHIENHVSPLCKVSVEVMRSEFEKLPIIQEIITDEYDGLMFDERFSKYLCPSDGNEEYLNGAWMVWQHQQSKVDELQKRVDAALQLVNEMKGKRYPFSAYADQLEQALKGDQ